MEKSSNKSPVTMEKPDDLENIEDFKRLCEINCKGDEEIKDMVELRRKIKIKLNYWYKPLGSLKEKLTSWHCSRVRSSGFSIVTGDLLLDFSIFFKVTF